MSDVLVGLCVDKCNIIYVDNVLQLALIIVLIVSFIVAMKRKGK